MTKSENVSGFIPVVIILIFGIFVATGAYYLGNTGFLKTYFSSPTSSPIASVVPTPDPTANWKTYKKDFPDPKNLYPSVEVKYPQEWTYTKMSLEGTADQRITFKDENGTSTIALNISVLDFVQLYNSTPKQSWGTGDLNLVNIGRNSGYHFQNSKSYIDAYYFPHSRGYVSIQLLNVGYLNIYNQILSTFKFLDESAGGQGITFRGIVVYGIGTTRDCNLLTGLEKENCLSKKVITPTPSPVITKLMISNLEKGTVQTITTEPIPNYQIALAKGSYKICAPEIMGSPCSNIEVVSGKFIDFSIPIPAQ